MKAALVLRPEPGNAATAERLAKLGVAIRCCPLFMVRPIAWTPPDPSDHDAVLLTSANSVRHAGAGLARLAALPVLAVGEATARAAAAAGLKVALTGPSDAAALLALASAGGWRRPLHLTGRDHVTLLGLDQVAVYASDPLPVTPAEVEAWRDHVALLHSPRAARRFAALIDDASLPRHTLGIAALSPAVATEAGTGWATLAIAATPSEGALIDAVRRLIDPPASAADKRA